jgi:transposase
MPENTNGGPEIGFLERAVGERKEIDLAQDVAAPPDPELVERARRRRFTAQYKLRILREADARSKSGEIGAHGESPPLWWGSAGAG